jgi:hypothetical protein
MHVEDRLGRTDGVRGDGHALKHVRASPSDERACERAARVGVVRVGHEQRLAPVLLRGRRDRAHLVGEGVARAAAAAEAGSGDERDERVR